MLKACEEIPVEQQPGKLLRLTAQGFQTQFHHRPASGEHTIPPLLACWAKGILQRSFGGMVERSRAEVVPPVLLAQPVQNFDGVVRPEFLRHETIVRGRHGVGKQVTQPASNAISRTVLRF